MNRFKLDAKKKSILYPEGRVPPKNLSIREVPSEPISSRSIPIEKASKKSVQSFYYPSIGDPKENSSKRITNRIDNIHKVKKRPDDKLTYDEKITKSVNFPFDKKLYRQLVSLKLTGKPATAPAPVSYETVRHDKEPRLEDFFKPTSKPEQHICVEVNLAPHSITKFYSGMRLHQVLKTHHDL